MTYKIWKGQAIVLKLLNMNSLPFFVKYLSVTCFLMNTLFMSAYIEDDIMSTETNKKYLKTKGNFSVSFREVWHWETTAPDIDWVVKKQQQLKTTFSEQFSSASSTSSCSAWHCLLSVVALVVYGDNRVLNACIVIWWNLWETLRTD